MLPPDADIVSIHATLAGGDSCGRSTPTQGGQVSIHATLAGGDKLDGGVVAKFKVFLSTPPSRVATNVNSYHFFAPLVSIHATLAGGDWKPNTPPSSKQRFYPRHPRGWRLFMKFC